jgi:hypothetical protein
VYINSRHHIQTLSLEKSMSCLLALDLLLMTAPRYLSSIEDRLKVVESRLDSFERHERPPTIRQPAAFVPSLPNESTAERAEAEAASVRDDSIGDAEAVEDPIDAMGAVTFAEEEDSAFFGPSSNIAFLRYVSSAVARLTNDSRPWKPSPVDRKSVSYNGELLNASRVPSPGPGHHEQDSEKVNIYALPTDPVARQLVAWFFSNAGVLFPFIHEASFMETFDQASKDKFKGVRRTWLALLNIVFAHAAVHVRDKTTTPGSVDSIPFRPDAESEVYFKRAYGLYNEKGLDRAGTSVEVGLSSRNPPLCI